MSEKKKGFNPWIATVILGVLAILFSVFAIQEQSTAAVAQKEAATLKEELIECERKAAAQLKIAQNEALAARKQADELKAEQEANSKNKKR